MKPIKPRTLLTVLLSAVFFLAVVVVPSGTAVANGPQFTMLTSSGRAGSAVDIREDDPCPPTPSGFDMQYVQINFVDANGVRNSGYGASVNPSDGHWGGNAVVEIPWKKVLQYDPPTYSTDAALGMGVVEAKCVIAIEGMDENGDPVIVHEETSMVYDSQDYEVTGAAPMFIAFPGVVEGGETLDIASSEPCFGEIYASIINNNAVMSAYEVVNSPGGTWALELPTRMYDDMGQISNEPFPPGMYTVGARCLRTGEIYSFNFSETIVEVTPQQLFNHYVVMGDSYSSGTGAGSYNSESGDCYRSSDSYGAYVADELGLDTPFVTACHGAQTADFYEQNPNTGMPEQLDFLTTNTEYVNLTIGGNDAGFESVLNECAQYPGHDGWGCSTDTSLNPILNDRLDTLAGSTSTVLAPDGRVIQSLAELYEDIAAAAPNAEIYVGGYPELFGDDIANYTANSNAPGGAQCNITASIGATMSYGDAQWLNQKADELNDIIVDAVDDAQNEGVNITFVPAALFTGHGLCDSQEEWIHPVLLDSWMNIEAESFHPTQVGYVGGYGAAFATIMS